MSTRIKRIVGREILSSSSFPTLEVDVILENGIRGRASVPYGASAGKYEAVTILDKDEKRFHGAGMLTAVENVKRIESRLKGMDVLDQQAIDMAMVRMDGTNNKSRLGANAILAVSLACSRAGAKATGQELYEYIREKYEFKRRQTLPKPMMVMIEGGKHADNSLDFQEFLVSCLINDTREAIRAGVETYQELAILLKKDGYSTNVGNEGAYAPMLAGSEKALKYIKEAIEHVGYEKLKLSLDPAASHFFNGKEYVMKREGKKFAPGEMIEYYKYLTERYGIFSIEDGLSEDDWDHWPIMREKLHACMIIGDDLTVTNKNLLKKAVGMNAINGMIIKPNQVGTLTETIETIRLAKENGISIIVSHRGGGETTDTFIVDLAVGCGADLLKVGPSRGERTVKYNRLMEISEGF